jgi:hypothetical protein
MATRSKKKDKRLSRRLTIRFVAEEVAGRLNHDEARREQDKWSA